ncbi:MAG TPA: choice-of-anchor Q domain-containing protein [Gemmatimonadales bacterium]|nr:choice-of-anchor Q domain-containing protein [Gemmatimonadales bacterium]
MLLPLVAIWACGEQESPTAPAGAAPVNETAAAAGQLVVNTLADPGDGACNATQCTLREAINDPSGNAIVFASGLRGTITLAGPAQGGGSLVIKRSLSITGPSTGITIRRRPADPAFRIMKVDPAVTVGLTKLALRNGRTDKQGGGILNYGTLTLTDCTVAGNTAAKYGGGIDNHGPLTLVRTTVSNNAGGGVDDHDVALTIRNSTITYNTGGGVANRAGGLTITNSTISYNGGTGIGHDWGTTTLDRVRIVGNSGGGVYGHQGTIAVSNSAILRNSTTGDGGGIATAQMRLTVTGSTIAYNTAGGNGGGISSRSWVRSSYRTTLTNTTVSGNSAAYGGGVALSDGYDAGGLGTFVNSTIAFNSATSAGGGIYETSNEDAVVQFTNSIFAKNAAVTGADLAIHTVLRGASHNLIGDGAGTGFTNEDGNIVGNVAPYNAPVDPLLGPLANNGGPTSTHALLAGSPAIDAGTSDGCPGIDQRGVTRPQGPACDMGSYELEAAGN